MLYDKVPKALNFKFRALAQKTQLKIRELKDAYQLNGVMWRLLTEEYRVDFFEHGPENS